MVIKMVIKNTIIYDINCGYYTSKGAYDDNTTRTSL